MTLKALKVAAVAVAAACLAGCNNPAGSGTRGTQATYTRDVAPILFARCAPCHHPGGSAPFSVLEYQAVRTRAREIVAATESRRMPPWLPEKGYGEFAGERRLEAGQ